MKPKPKRAAKMLPRRSFLGLLSATLASSATTSPVDAMPAKVETEYWKTWQLIGKITPSYGTTALFLVEYFSSEPTERPLIMMIKDEKISSASVRRSPAFETGKESLPASWKFSGPDGPAYAEVVTDDPAAEALFSGDFVDFELDHWPDMKFKRIVRRNGEWVRYYDAKTKTYCEAAA